MRYGSTVQPESDAPEPTIEGPLAEAFLGTLRVATKITTAADAEFRRAGSGVKASDWDILALLALAGPLRPSKLVQMSSLSGNPTTVSTILGRLQTRGYIQRRPLSDDPRGVVVHVTDEGQELFAQVFPTLMTKVVGPFALHFTDDELQTLASYWSRF